MTKVWAKVLVVLILTAPAGVAADKKKPAKKKPAPELTVEKYESKERGAIQVTGDTDCWFQVLAGDKGGKDVAYPYPVLGATVEVEPGEYEVALNGTSRRVKVQAGQKVVLRSGTLVVEGADVLWWYAKDGERTLSGVNRNSPGPGSPRALFPGTYAVGMVVRLQDVPLTNSAKVEVGKKTVVKR